MPTATSPKRPIASGARVRARRDVHAGIGRRGECVDRESEGRDVPVRTDRPLLRLGFVGILDLDGDSHDASSTRGEDATVIS